MWGSPTNCELLEAQGGDFLSLEVSVPSGQDEVCSCSSTPLLAQAESAGGEGSKEQGEIKKIHPTSAGGERRRAKPCAGKAALAASLLSPSSQTEISMGREKSACTEMLREQGKPPERGEKHWDFAFIFVGGQS